MITSWKLFRTHALFNETYNGREKKSEFYI